MKASMHVAGALLVVLLPLAFAWGVVRWTTRHARRHGHVASGTTPASHRDGRNVVEPVSTSTSARAPTATPPRGEGRRPEAGPR